MGGGGGGWALEKNNVYFKFFTGIFEIRVIFLDDGEH